MATRVHYNPSEPGIPQVYNMGKSYGPWCYKPLKHFGPDQSLVVIGGPLEALTHAPLWMPTIWLGVALCLFVRTCFHSGFLMALSMLLCGAVFLFPLIEYALHRWVLHMSTKSGNGVINVIHFLLHGIHHLTPQDTTRLLAPFPLILALATPMFLTMSLVISMDLNMALWAGIFNGYVVYDYTHLYLHTPGRKPVWIRDLVKHHQGHHRHQHHKFYGISYLSNLIWDNAFGTQ